MVLERGCLRSVSSQSPFLVHASPCPPPCCLSSSPETAHISLSVSASLSRARVQGSCHLCTNLLESNLRIPSSLYPDFQAIPISVLCPTPSFLGTQFFQFLELPWENWLAYLQYLSTGTQHLSHLTRKHRSFTTSLLSALYFVMRSQKCLLVSSKYAVSSYLGMIFKRSGQRPLFHKLELYVCLRGF